MSPIAVADEVPAAVGARSSACNRQAIIRTGDFVVDLETRVLSVHDKPVRLTGKEYCIIELLSLRKDTVLTKQMLLDHLYGGMPEPAPKIIDVFVPSAQKAGAGDGRQTLYRDRLGSRLSTARSG